MNMPKKPSYQELENKVHALELSLKAAKEGAREKEDFLNSLINAIPVPVFYKDRGGKYMGCNEAFEALFGMEREEMIGKTVFDINPKELAEIYHAKDMALFDDGGIQQYDSQVKNTSGQLRDVIFYKSVYTKTDGTTQGLIGAVLDVTELRKANQEREELISRLEKALEDIKHLSGIVPICSHCKSIRDDKGYWNRVESYLALHPDAGLSHGICPDCARKHYPDLKIHDE